MAHESWKREKDETDCKVPEGLILCVNNCGLFGSPATLDMCSKCYGESLLKKPNSPTLLPSILPYSPSPSSTSAADAPEKASKRKPETGQRPVKDGSTAFRCSSCQRKVGLTGFRCRCGDLFCAKHRYSDTHDCSYDYKAAGREAIARENPVVKAAKIIKF